MYKTTKREEQLTSELERCGIIVCPGVREWGIEAFDDAMVSTLRDAAARLDKKLVLALYGAVTDEALSQLVGMSSIVQLSLGGRCFTARGFAFLPYLPELHTLVLIDVSFDHSAVVSVTRIPKLKVLELEDITLSEDIVESLGALKGVVVTCDGQRIGDNWPE